MKLFYKAEEAFVGVTIMVVTFLLFISIVLRLFSLGITWSEELIRYAIIWITFIGSGICFRKGIHVGIDVLMDALPQKGKNVLGLIINVLAIIFMIFLIKYGFSLVMFSKGTGQITPALQVPMYWIYLAIPLGAILSLFHLCMQTFGMIRKRNKVYGEGEA